MMRSPVAQKVVAMMDLAKIKWAAIKPPKKSLVKPVNSNTFAVAQRLFFWLLEMLKTFFMRRSPRTPENLTGLAESRIYVGLMSMGWVWHSLRSLRTGIRLCKVMASRLKREGRPARSHAKQEGTCAFRPANQHAIRLSMIECFFVRWVGFVIFLQVQSIRSFCMFVSALWPLWNQLVQIQDYLYPRKSPKKCSFERFLLFERFFPTWA